MYDPNDVPDNISGARDDARMEMKPLPTNVPHVPALRFLGYLLTSNSNSRRPPRACRVRPGVPWGSWNTFPQ